MCKNSSPQKRAGETKPGAENKLSIDCEFGQLLSNGTTTILVWEGSESIIAGHSPERLYLYSSCVDPTTTYLHVRTYILYHVYDFYGIFLYRTHQ